MDQNTYIEQAAAHFRALLTEQLNRQERMAQGSPAKDFSRMERIVIGLIPGDGIGPILMAQKSCWRTRLPMAGWSCGTSRG
jgi:isocitrate dehydrogenase (NAD+)